MAKQVGIKVDPINNIITLGRAFYKKAQVYNSLEYKALSEVKAEFPEAKIKIKDFKKNTSMEHYKDLTYGFMQDYIKANDISLLAEFDLMIDISKCHSTGKRYPTIKKWFLEKFPEVGAFGKSVEELKKELEKKKLMDLEQAGNKSDSEEDAEQFNAAADF